jgi:hypothetical protein
VSTKLGVDTVILGSRELKGTVHAAAGGAAWLAGVSMLGGRGGREGMMATQGGRILVLMGCWGEGDWRFFFGICVENGEVDTRRGYNPNGWAR